MIQPPMRMAGTDDREELERLAEDARMFKLALSLLSPPSQHRGLRLLQRAYQAICDRAECAELEAAALREEVANLKHGMAAKQ